MEVLVSVALSRLGFTRAMDVKKVIVVYDWGYFKKVRSISLQVSLKHIINNIQMNMNIK